MPRFEADLICWGPPPSSPPPNHQAFEGLLLNAADMAVANSMQPATARKPMGVNRLQRSFPFTCPPACRRCDRTARALTQARHSEATIHPSRSLRMEGKPLFCCLHLDQPVKILWYLHHFSKSILRNKLSIETRRGDGFPQCLFLLAR